MPTVTVPDISGALGAGIDAVVAQGITAVGVVFPPIMGLVGAIVIWRLGLRLFRSAVT